ncbi:MAG: hypothetical protein QXF52_07400 [Thermoproteota archaeon]
MSTISILVVLGVTGFLIYLAITEGALLMVFWSVLCFSIGLAILGWLVYALKTVPEYIREFERKVLKVE